MAQAAKNAGVAHVIWSTLEDARLSIPLESDQMPTLMGHYKVPHFDAKGEANAEFINRHVPVTFLLTSYYWDNFIHFPGMGLTRGADGVLTLRLPMGDKKLPGIAAEDIGRCAYGILRAGDRYVGEMVGIAGEHLTGAQLASGLGRALGENVRYLDVPPETPAVLLSAEQRDGPSYRVGFHNFYVITRYNASARYVMAVHELAQAIALRVHPANPP